jgi:ribonuclease-3
LLQEQVQARGLPAPTYRVKGMRGPQHDPTFEVEVIVGEAVVGFGEGRSKRVAERAAALSALGAPLSETAVPSPEAAPAEESSPPPDEK